jgi:hypothetical protein
MAQVDDMLEILADGDRAGTVDPAPLVHAVVVNHEGAGLLAPCISHLLESGYPRLRVIVVDNASTDGSDREAISLFPQITVVRNEKNLGFAGGANAGLRLALGQGADFAWVLNTDVFVPPGCLGALIEVMRTNPLVGACQPALVLAADPGIVQSAGCGLGLTGRCWDIAAGACASSLGQALTEPPGVTGAAMFLRAAALREVGLFDERFFMYFEDVELCLRLRRAGYAVACQTKALASHVGAATANRLPAWRRILRCERNALILASRHYPLPWASLALILGPLSALGAAALRLALLKPDEALAYAAGALAGLVLGLGEAAERLGRGRSRAGDEALGRLVTRTIFPPRPTAPRAGVAPLKDTNMIFKEKDN